ncbi:hypothetical protein QIS99_28215 [Streptomyces sp. B-S-A8]|uniref:Pilus assembly protein n=1 Tax=Streptomyces solicavernae TaxID=3043614 RepID=A0ABT6S023_9ACTN|nr:hypothetical protein [Streptomyces sp. B-S-A8]MDI3390047.1 hypothetical protein [Streptomyces sp. B-S-A8]
MSPHTPPKARRAPARAGTWRARLREDTGAYTLEALVCTPVVLFVVVLLAAYGLAGIGDTTTANAAAAAARAASRASAPEGAEAAGQDAARSALSKAGRTCEESSIEIDVSNFPKAVGDPGQVSVTVTCTVSLSQLMVPGLPGAKTLESTRVSYVDQYNSRTDQGGDGS